MDKRKKALDGSKILTGMVEAMDRQFSRAPRSKGKSEKALERTLRDSLHKRLARAKNKEEEDRIKKKLDYLSN